MPDATWKAVERSICRALGGQRTGPVGDEGPDCVGTYPYAVQIKHRANVPAWLLDSYRQAVDDAPAGEIPILVLHPKGYSHLRSLVILPLEDFLAPPPRSKNKT